jgi:hypothetical protein
VSIHPPALTICSRHLRSGQQYLPAYRRQSRMAARQIKGTMTRSVSAMLRDEWEHLRGIAKLSPVIKGERVVRLALRGIDSGGGISLTRCCRRHASHSRLGFRTKQAELSSTVNAKPAPSVSATGSVKNSQCSTTAGFRIYFVLAVVFCLLQGDRIRC